MNVEQFCTALSGGWTPNLSQKLHIYLRPLGVNGVGKTFIISTFQDSFVASVTVLFLKLQLLFHSWCSVLFWCVLSLCWQLLWDFPLLEGINMSLKALGNIKETPCTSKLSFLQRGFWTCQISSNCWSCWQTFPVGTSSCACVWAEPGTLVLPADWDCSRKVFRVVLVGSESPGIPSGGDGWVNGCDSQRPLVLQHSFAFFP